MSKTAMPSIKLAVEDLRVEFNHAGKTTAAVRDVSFTLGREKLAIVGELRLGQIHGRPQPAAPAPGNGQSDRENLAFRRCRPARLQRKTDAGHSWPTHVDDHARPEILTEPGDQGRRTDRRSLPGASPRVRKEKPARCTLASRRGSTSCTPTKSPAVWANGS